MAWFNGSKKEEFDEFSKQKKLEKSSSILKRSIGELGFTKALEISNKDLYQLDKNNTLLDALESSMNSQKEVISVFSSNKFAGILSKVDIISSINKENLNKIDKIKLESILSKDYSSCSKDESIEGVFNSFLKSDSLAIVLKKSGEFYGVLDYFDIISSFNNASFVIDNPPIIGKSMSREIKSIDCEANLYELIEKFSKEKSNYFLVYRLDVPVGIVTIKDLISSLYKNVNLENTHVQNIMSARMTYLEQWQDLNFAVKMVLDRRFNQIPIKENDKIVGIITVKDIVKSYYEFLLEVKKGQHDVEELN